MIQVGEENSLVTRVVDPYFTQYWNRLDFLCLLSSGKTVLTILDLEKMTPRIPLSDDVVVYWYSSSNHYTKRAFTQP